LKQTANFSNKLWLSRTQRLASHDAKVTSP